MTQREDHLKLLILDLLSPARSVAPDALINLDEAEQAALLKDIRDHRLGPMLRYMHQNHHADVTLPETLKHYLEQSYRKSVFRSLHIQQALHHLNILIGQAGVPYVALKGAFLAYHAYPNPALRPMRDIDMLVPYEQAIEVFQQLLAAGYQRTHTVRGDVASYFALSHQLPPLMSPHGNVSIELHHRISNPQTDDAPFTIDDNFWARSIDLLIGGRLIRVESPTDLLRHLIHHAVYHHQFNVGPLFITDVAYLIANHPIDWDTFWQLAETDCMLPGALLSLHLVKAYWPNIKITWPTGAHPVPSAEILLTAKLALLGDHDRRVEVMFRGTVATLPLKEKAKIFRARFLPTRQALGATYPVDPNSWAAYRYYSHYYLRLWTKQIPRFFSISKKSHGHELKQMAQLRGWLKSAK